jgi:hypothetical protein
MRPRALAVCCRLSVILAMLALLNACSKSDSGGNNIPATSAYYMKFKLDGVQIEFKQNTDGVFNKPQSNGDYTCINGGTKEQFVATKNNIAVLMTTVGQHNLNTTYTCYKTTTAGFVKAKLLAVSYLDDNAFSWASWSEDLVAGLPAGTETKANLTITEANSTSIKGTFNAVLYNTGFTKKAVLTEGEFYLKPQ